MLARNGANGVVMGNNRWAVRRAERIEPSTPFDPFFDANGQATSGSYQDAELVIDKVAEGRMARGMLPFLLIALGGIAGGWIMENPIATGFIVTILSILAFMIWVHRRPEKKPDPGHDRHYDGIQVLKILAIANNRIDDTDRMIIGAYMRDIPGSIQSADLSAEMVGQDLPSPADLDKHLDGAAGHLQPDETARLVDCIREMRRVERRLNPTTAEWFDRAEKRLTRPVGRLRVDHDGLGLSIGITTPDENPFDARRGAISLTERYDVISSALDPDRRSGRIRSTMASLRVPLEMLDANPMDEDLETEADELIDDQLKAAVSSYVTVASLLKQNGNDHSDETLVATIDRIREAVDDVVARQTGRAIARLETVRLYVEAKNPRDLSV